MPSPLLVKPPVAGATVPPSCALSVSVVPAPMVWMMISRPVVPVMEPGPLMALLVVTRMPPLSSESAVFAPSAIAGCTAGAALSVSELMPVLW